MTDPFEQAVADALRDIWWHPRAPAFGGAATVSCLSAETVEHIAPRVAAAIEAALPLGVGIPGWNDMRDEFKRAALAALRGTSP